MLNVGTLTQSQSADIFKNSESVNLIPVVSAEWNHNLFNTPYLTVAGTGNKISGSLTSGTIANVTTGAKPNFTTKSFNMANGKGSVEYAVTATGAFAYKIVTYVKTNNAIPVMVTASAKGSVTQFGSEQVEADSLGWTKIITYIGSNGEDAISSFVYTIKANSLSGTDINPTVLFTVPEIYETTFFDYQYHSLWPTENPFTYFRPGESYVTTGDANFAFPTDYRKITSSVLNGYSTATYSPVSPIVQNPSFFLASSPVPVLKNALPTDISPYKYFVSDPMSDTYDPSISAIYEKPITTNKLVLKFNTIMTTPTINISINGSQISVDSSTSISLANSGSNPLNGVIVLYWTGTAWTKTKWSEMPQFSATGALAKSTTISKITITEASRVINTGFSSLSGASTPGTNINNDFNRMHLVEVSPRLEIDLSDFVQDISIDKSLDSGSSPLPISSINTNDARIVLSGIPAMNGSTLVPIFSSQSDQSSTILSNLLRKNVKFYINFNLKTYASLSGGASTSNKYIPGGVFYSDSWDENDIQDVSIQCFDVSRYLQATPVPDYVANLRNVFEVITNILDMAGFTDYDYDSLYAICKSKSAPLDISYYYSNSKDSTIVDALNQIFVAYQIGAYIDEYGIMKFISLSKILDPSTSSVFTITDSDIEQGGFSISNKAKPGKISLRYQTPKIKQSPSLQNIKDLNIKNSPSFIYTTSNDVVWQQQTIDSVGFNYLDANMAEDDNVFKINNNDLLDIFHTFNLNNEGYAVIEDEIVSFVYKEYKISNLAETEYVYVSVKNNLELSSEIDNFIKKYSIGLKNSYCTITNASGNGTTVTYTAVNDFSSGQRVSITGMNPVSYSITGIIASASANSFTVDSKATGSFLSGGEAVIAADYDILITPTGNITNVQRGMFGTSPSSHARISSLSSSGLSEEKITKDYLNISSSNLAQIINDKTSNTGELTDSLPSISKIKVSTAGNHKTIIYPTDAEDIGYSTYSVKFELPEQSVCSAGLFFNMESHQSTSGAYFVQLARYNQTSKQTSTLYDPPRYKYILTITDTDDTVYAWSEVTGECQSIINNFAKIIQKKLVGNKNEYSYITDNAFNLKVVHYTSDGSDGENATDIENREVVSVFLNNVEVTGWQVPGEAYDSVTNPDGRGYKSTEPNPLTGMRQKPTIPANLELNTKFGFIATNSPNEIEGLNPEIGYPTASSTHAASLREIHATKKALKERSVSYFYQDREFLNGMVQGQPLSSNSPTYIMQTTPEIIGINYYDVQYTTPAAVSVDILPIEYLWYYFPGNEPEDQTNYQKKIIDEYSLSYSTPINTGFRAKMAVINNSPNMVFLQKESDEINQFTINFNLWTHEIIAPSDPEIIEQVIDSSNLSEVIQLDSEWIQSKNAAYKTLKIIEMGLEGFSKEVTLNVFGNPLIQTGDIITLSYSLNGISQQRYVVHSVSHSFSQGLSTTLKLNRIQ